MGLIRSGLLLCLVSFVSSCAYCRDIAHKDETRCKVQALITDCGGKLISSLIIDIVPQLVTNLVSENWASMVDNLVQTLEQKGVKDGLHVVACAMQHIDGTLVPIVGSDKPAFANQNTVAVHTHAQLWLKRYGRAH